jgi:hypothetical protein
LWIDYAEQKELSSANPSRRNGVLSSALRLPSDS